MAPRHKVEDEPHKVQELLRRIQVAQKQQQQREQNGNANGSANGVANGDGKDGQEEGMSREQAEAWFLTEECLRRCLRARSWYVHRLLLGTPLRKLGLLLLFFLSSLLMSLLFLFISHHPPHCRVLIASRHLCAVLH